MSSAPEASRRSRFPIAFALAAILLAADVARAEEKVSVTWHGQRYDAGSLLKEAADLPEGARAAVVEWETWARKAGYRMDFDATGRVLLLTAEKSSRVESTMAIVARTESWFDELLPSIHPPPPAVKASRPTPASKGSVNIPEDPEGAPPVLAPPKSPKAKSGSAGSKPESGAPGSGSGSGSAWGSGSFVPDARTAVLIALADEKDQESALGYLAQKHAELASWTAKAGTDLGFVIENPLLAAFVESAAGQDEWNPEHEILNRLVRLLILGRFGQMPNWVMHAVAWEAETAFDGSIWVYPYRSEFVYTTEHTAWLSELSHEFQDRAKKPLQPLQIEELTGWSRGTWDGSSARHAFGLIHFLAASKRQALPALLADLRAHRDENNRKIADDGTWTRNPDWEAPPAAQLAILRARCGESVLADVGAWLARQGSSKARTLSQDGSGKSQEQRQ